MVYRPLNRDLYLFANNLSEEIGSVEEARQFALDVIDISISFLVRCMKCNIEEMEFWFFSVI